MVLLTTASFEQRERPAPLVVHHDRRRHDVVAHQLLEASGGHADIGRRATAIDQAGLPRDLANNVLVHPGSPGASLRMA
jgi:hypothetical protein